MKAEITYTEDGRTEEIETGETQNALYYEVADMQEYIEQRTEKEPFSLTKDVTCLFSAIRNQWGLQYPFE